MSHQISIHSLSTPLYPHRTSSLSQTRVTTHDQSIKKDLPQEQGRSKDLSTTSQHASSPSRSLAGSQQDCQIVTANRPFEHPQPALHHSVLPTKFVQSPQTPMDPSQNTPGPSWDKGKSEELPTFDELIAERKRINAQLAATTQFLRESRIRANRPIRAKMDQKITEFHARIIDQEPDALAICPSDTNHMVVGTYSYINKDETSGSEGATREGTLQVIPVVEPAASSKPPFLDCHRFAFGIYDVHFHPKDPSILGVATSAGEMWFFRMKAKCDLLNRLQSIHLIVQGKITVEEPGEGGYKPIVTQFTWLRDFYKKAEKGNASAGDEVILSATTQLGSTRLIKLSVPNVKTHLDQRDDQEVVTLDSLNVLIHTQPMVLEAWVSEFIPLHSNKYLLVSGGDDSQLIASAFNINFESRILTNEPNRMFVEKRKHEAGITSLAYLGKLGPFGDNNKFVHLLLTGSYDQELRLFELDEANLRPNQVGGIKLDGGVWRIAILDMYIGANEQTEFILCVAGHLGGAFVVRLTGSTRIMGTGETIRLWKFGLEAQFLEGHESMVYAIDARIEREDRKTKMKKFLIATASFYDKKICTWEWEDHRA